MALTLWQRIRVAWRGWARRRDERNQEFLRKNAVWNSGEVPRAPSPSVAPPTPKKPSVQVDFDGLHAAYLDRSGRIAYYLDTLTGEVVQDATGDSSRFKRVPSQTPDSEAADRAEFAKEKRSDLAGADAARFRAILATDRALERSWYSFKNDRATTAIESWLRSLGLR